MEGNLIDSFRWSKGRARCFMSRHIALLLAIAGVGAFARVWMLEDAELQGGEVIASSTGVTRSMESNLSACSEELTSIKSKIEEMRASKQSRARPRRLLFALSESVPAGVWIESVQARGDAVEIIARAQSENAVQETLRSLESCQQISEVRLESSSISDDRAALPGIEFRVSGRIRPERSIGAG